jgi:tetratricopeptide (TPR) repeat protein
MRIKFLPQSLLKAGVVLLIPWLIFLIVVAPALADKSREETLVPQALELNNAGVADLTKGDYKGAIKKFEAALKLDAEYGVARLNLATAHDDLAVILREQPKLALEHLHAAVCLEPNHPLFSANLKFYLNKLGNNPDNFLVRKKLGDQAMAGKDLFGAVVEYGAALKLKKDVDTQKKYDKAVRSLRNSRQNYPL